MAEISYPGVYVTEVDRGPKAIEGVPTSTTAMLGLVGDIRRALGPFAPDWTEHNDADPGAAVLELLAWLAEVVRYRADCISDRGMLHASRLAIATLAIIADREMPEGGALKRSNFYSGRLIGAADLVGDQAYRRDRQERLHRHNRELHGAGVVRGLQVSIDDTGGKGDAAISVSAGYAIDARGREVVVSVPIRLCLPAAATAAFVVAVRNPPAPAFIVRDVADECTLRVVASPPDDSFVLAQLTRSPHGWQIQAS